MLSVTFVKRQKAAALPEVDCETYGNNNILLYYGMA